MRNHRQTARSAGPSAGVIASAGKYDRHVRTLKAADGDPALMRSAARFIADMVLTGPGCISSPGWYWFCQYVGRHGADALMRRAIAVHGFRRGADLRTVHLAFEAIGAGHDAQAMALDAMGAIVRGDRAAVAHMIRYAEAVACGRQGRIDPARIVDIRSRLPSRDGWTDVRTQMSSIRRVLNFAVWPERGAVLDALCGMRLARRSGRGAVRPWMGPDEGLSPDVVAADSVIIGRTGVSPRKVESALKSPLAYPILAAGVLSGRYKAKRLGRGRFVLVAGEGIGL